MKTAKKKPKKPKKKLPQKPILKKKKAVTKKQNSQSKQVDQIFEKWNTPDSPGFAIAVRHNGAIVYRRGFGTADLDHGIPILPDTVFHAASLTKQFTAMAIMLLINNPKLANPAISLNTEVHALIPQLSGIDKNITIGQLLHHTSGVRDQWVLATMAGWRLSDDVITRKDVMDRFVALSESLNFDPGNKFSYSNTNYTIAGDIVKKVSGMKLSAFCDKYIFKPLNMSRTRIIDTHGEIVQHRAYGYRPTSAGWEVRMPNYDLTGPTNLQTTVDDLMRWDGNFDSMSVGGAAALTAMQTPAPPAAPIYGLGLFIDEDNGRRIVEHDGRDAGYRSHLIRFPDQKLSVALLCNIALDDPLPSTGTLVRQVAAIYLGSGFVTMGTMPVLPPVAAAPLDPAQYVGKYYSKEIDATYTVVLKGTSLQVTREKYPPTTLLPAGPNGFFMMKDFSIVLPQVLVQFNIAQGAVIGFRMDDSTLAGRLGNFHFKKV
ncbi:serine hydrolase domain-containing protein [Bradyrhizobium sp.]|uniref:serine hydrolase domain-containing protein n=1 Tax=Bradyrhizobium sp. TaxID=376 RepID=UPI001D58085E|nr:serine hydrolase domain-containing protein [Bradyrhizobium sp.]MBI5322920.1 beta-lactamase family protein [Bradyrhizobium sp.]